MQPNQGLVLDVRQWLERSRIDVDAADRLLGSYRNSPAETVLPVVGFHCQQAAEKAIKAFLTWHVVRFPFSHDLEALAKLAVTIDGAFQRFTTDLKDLTAFATSFRYPGAPLPPSLAETERLRRLAGEALDLVVSLLPAACTEE